MTPAGTGERLSADGQHRVVAGVALGLGVPKGVGVPREQKGSGSSWGAWQKGAQGGMWGERGLGLSRRGGSAGTQRGGRRTPLGERNRRNRGCCSARKVSGCE